VNLIGGHTGSGDGIGVAVFLTFFFFFTGFLVGFLVGFFVVDETDGFAAALFETAGVALALGLALGVGDAACADESRREADVIAAISKFRFTLCST
jgi:hypothetical protein